MAESFGWTGELLRVDLSSGRITTVETSRYATSFVGGVGIAARMAWDELVPGLDPFHPTSPLYVMTGPLTGTLASGAGRVEILGVAPQQHPSVFSRSGMGGHWGAELKYAGYDGVIVTGAASAPVYLWIEDGKAELREASDLWGMGTYGTTRALRARHGQQTRVISCGQAGERLARIAVIQTETGNAAGQGGFGAVMGAKKLKAVAVRGSRGVKIARPREFLELCLRNTREGLVSEQDGPRQRGRVHQRLRKCGFCASACAHPFAENVRMPAGPPVPGVADQCWTYIQLPSGDRAGVKAVTSEYGLNGWEISYGIIPWLQLCRQHGLITQIDGMEIPVPDQPIEYLEDMAPVSAEFLYHLVKKIAMREGALGDALADGACYAAERLFGGEGIPLLDRIYPRHAGQTDHWTGHWVCNDFPFPWWLPPILQWSVDTRDPASDSTHQWTVHVRSHVSGMAPGEAVLPMSKIRAISERVYGHPDVCDPSFGYEPPDLKVIPALWHSHRGMLVNSLILCDYEHSRVFSAQAEDGAADTGLMARLTSACTGLDVSEGDLNRAGERIWNVLRAIDVRYFGRDRTIDESTFAGFAYPSFHDRISLDVEKAAMLLTRYYEMSGWDTDHGWPTRDQLHKLGLDDIALGLKQDGKLG